MRGGSLPPAAQGLGQTRPKRPTFLNPKARDFSADWERAADDIVAVLRSTAGKNPYDKDLTDLIGELLTEAKSSAPGGHGTM